MSAVLDPSAIGDCCDFEAPVVAEVVRVACAHRIDAHRHVRGQMVYSADAALELITENARQLVPPRYAVWIPPNAQHAIRAATPIEYNSLFVANGACAGLPGSTQLVEVSRLLAELTRTAAAIDPRCNGGPESRLRQVILDQLDTVRPVSHVLPLPRTQRLRRLTSHLTDQPGEQRDLESWASELCMSGRTLSRRFRLETGMSYGQWIRRLRVVKAMERLAGGHSVKAIAWEVGYQQTSAFITMFRRETGMTPAQFAKSLH